MTDRESVIESIGKTPLVDLPAGLAELRPGVRVMLKLEGANPGGSVKDRAAREIVLEAERSGQLQPGGTILDASSGNTGIAYALIAASRGYRLMLALPRNASPERRQLLAAYGATVIDTSPLEGTDGAQREAARLALAHPDWTYLNQYDNDANWRAHFRTTGPELLSQTGGAITHLVATVGTSGTLTGTGRFLRRRVPGVRLIEVQPDGPMHGLEGVKHLPTARVPGIYDVGLADEHHTASTEDGYRWVRALARRGLLVGPSSGAATHAAVALARTLDRGVVVAILPDSGTRYLSDARIWTAEPDEEASWQKAS